MMRVLLYYSCLLMATVSHAQQPSPTMANNTSSLPGSEHVLKIDPKRPLPDACTPEQVREYMQLARVGQAVQTMLTTFVQGSRATSAPYYPAEFWDDMEKSLTAIDFVETYIPIYQQYITRADMQQIIDFYKSPAGRRLLDAQPPITLAGQATFKQLGQQVGLEVYERHRTVIEEVKARYQQKSPAGPTPVSGLPKAGPQK